MEFGWINGAGAVLVVLMLVPNVIFAIRNPGQGNKCRSPWMNLLEQIGRYGSMALMAFPLGVWKFGFPSVAEFLIYLFANGALLISYWVFWWFYFRKATPKLALVLAVLPTCIFLVSGLTLRHWLLVFASVIFGAGHIYVTRENNK